MSECKTGAKIMMPGTATPAPAGAGLTADNKG
jgi:hypothetical protein